jgi:hypothetical protein
MSPKEKKTAWSAVQEHMTDESAVRVFLAQGQDVSLTSMEKPTVLQSILGKNAAVERHTMPLHERAVECINAFLRFGWAAPALVILLMATMVGASYASADSLPGDSLYFMKKVGEQIRTGLSLTTESRAEGETKRMDTRVWEVERLQQESKFTDDMRATLDQEFKLERRTAIQHIQSLEEAGNADTANRLRARLNALEDRYDRLVNGERPDGENKKRRDFPTIKDSEDEDSSAVNVINEVSSFSSVSVTVTSSSSSGDSPTSSESSSTMSDDAASSIDQVKDRAIERVLRKIDESMKERTEDPLSKANGIVSDVATSSAQVIQ